MNSNKYLTMLAESDRQMIEQIDLMSSNPATAVAAQLIRELFREVLELQNILLFDTKQSERR